MNLGELMSHWRRRVKDPVAPYLWSDEEGILYANQAEREAAERALLIEDTVTAAVCKINGKEGVAVYKRHPKIIKINRVQWGTKVLKGRAREDIDAIFPCVGNSDWSTLTGDPDYFIDPQDKILTLVRIPTRDELIRLWVHRYPLNDMEGLDDEPELAERHHFNLIDWMEHLSYLKQDSQTFNQESADRAEAVFTRNFGPKIEANIRRQQRRRSGNQIVMNPDW